LRAIVSLRTFETSVDGVFAWNRRRERAAVEAVFVVFIAFGMVIFIILTSLYPDAFWIAPIVLIAVQSVFIFYSSSFIARTADWHITEANPTIHLLEYHLPIRENEDLKQALTRDQLLAIKKEIYDEILAKRGEIDCNAAQKFSENSKFFICPLILSNRKGGRPYFSKSTLQNSIRQLL